MDMKKYKYYSELGAIGGDVQARHNLGAIEHDASTVENSHTNDIRPCIPSLSRCSPCSWSKVGVNALASSTKIKYRSFK